MITTITDMCEC